jgi:hypothetical protein
MANHPERRELPDGRLSAVYVAKTYGGLEPVTRALPDTPLPASTASNRIGGAPTSSAEEQGPWRATALAPEWLTPPDAPAAEAGTSRGR